MTEKKMPALPPEDRRFLSAWMRFFRVPRVNVAESHSPTSDIAVSPVGPDGVPTLILGRKWREHRATNPALARQQITHEGVHLAGLAHSDYARRRGYWSRDRAKDTLSARIYSDLMAGTRHFDPRRFGLDPSRLTRLAGRTRRHG